MCAQAFDKKFDTAYNLIGCRGATVLLLRCCIYMHGPFEPVS